MCTCSDSQQAIVPTCRTRLGCRVGVQDSRGMPDEPFLPCARRGVRRRLCADEEVEVVPADGTLQRLQDGCGVVTGPLDEVGLAVAPEADGARTTPRPQMPSGCLEAGRGLEAEASRIPNGAEHQV